MRANDFYKKTLCIIIWCIASFASQCRAQAQSETSAAQKSDRIKLVEYARRQIGVTTIYDPAYVRLKFPNGDVAKERGVCTDVVIRAYRHLGKDLQRLVNQDMKANFSKYPKRWGMKRTDSNIDHRRVPNLQVFFKRQGKNLTVTKDKSDYRAGDIVTWMLDGNLPHIGIVSTRKTSDGTPLVIHNIGRGTQEDNILFKFKITGHYRY